MLLRNSEPKNFNLKPIPVLFLLLITAAYCGIAGRDMITRGEGREALVAQAIMNSGDWILPHTAYGDVPSKPPFLHWMIACVSEAAGTLNEFTARLPSAIFYTVLVFIFYFFIKERYGRKQAFLTAAILGFCAEFYRAGVSCRVDIIFSSLLFLGLLSQFVWHERQLKGLPWKAVIFLTCAALCKGPAALVLGVGIFAVYLLIQREPVLNIIRAVFLVALPVCIFSLSWYFAAYYDAGKPFLDKVYYENVSRFLGTMDDEPHNHGVMYLLGTVPLGMMPWTLIILPLLFLAGFKRPSLAKLKELDNFKLYGLLSTILVTVFFCIPSSKRSVYLLPIYPFFAFYAAMFLLQIETEKPNIMLRASKIFQRAGLSLIALAAGVYLLASSLTFSKPRPAFYAHEINLLGAEISYTGIFLVCLLLLYCSYFIFNKKYSLFNSAILTGLLFSCLQYNIVRPFTNHLSSKEFAIQLKAKIDHLTPFFSYQNEFYALSFYMQREFTRLTPANAKKGAIIVIYEDALENLKAAYPGPIEIEFKSENYIEKPLRKLIAVKFST